MRVAGRWGRWQGRSQPPWGPGQRHQGRGDCGGRKGKEQSPVTKLGHLVQDMKMESLEGTCLLPARRGI